jgi:hypothetical protein
MPTTVLQHHCFAGVLSTKSVTAHHDRLYILVASALLIVGFSTAADHGFKTPSAYGVIIAGAVILAVAVWHYLTTKRNALIPAVGIIIHSLDSSHRI